MRLKLLGRQYQLGELPECIKSFERSLRLQPSADAHSGLCGKPVISSTNWICTANVASAYILSVPPNAAAAIEHLQVCHLSEADGEADIVSRKRLKCRLMMEK